MEYIPRTPNKKLIITDQTSSLEKKFNSKTTEALTSKITFCLKTMSKMK